MTVRHGAIPPGPECPAEAQTMAWAALIAITALVPAAASCRSEQPVLTLDIRQWRRRDLSLKRRVAL